MPPVKLPLMWIALLLSPVLVGVYVTLTEQFDPAALVAGAVAHVVPETAKSLLSEVMVEINNGTVPTVSVTGCAALGVLISWGAKIRGVGERVAVDQTPVPCTGISVLPPVALSTTWIALFTSPAFDGVYVTPKVQLVPGALVVKQVVLVTTKSLLSELKLEIDSDTIPVTVNVTGCEALEVLTSWGAKVRTAGERDTVAALEAGAKSISHALRPWVAAASFLVLGSNVRPSTATLGKPVP